MPDQTSRRDGLTTSLGVKAPVRLATTAALAALSGLLVVDTVQTVAGDRVLVKDQANTVNNGIYDVNSGVWTRSKDADGNLDLARGTSVIVTDGTTNGGLFYKSTAANPVVVGTSALTWAITNATSALNLPIAIAQGGTGQTTADKAIAALGVIGLTAAGGAANAQTATAPSSVAALATNQLYEYTPAFTNTGAVTLTVTPSGGASFVGQNVFYDGAACAGSELVANVPTLLLYDGAQLHIVGYSRKIRGAQLGLDSHLINGQITATPAASALTLALKTNAGADPSPASPVGIIFRSATNADGAFTVLWVTAALNLVVSSGSSLGALSGSVPFRVWAGAFNDAGTPRLTVINPVTAVAGSGAGNLVTGIARIASRASYSATAEGGIGGADSAATFYADAAVANKAFTPLGYLLFATGLVTAGTWAVGPTVIMPFSSHVPLPGNSLQLKRSDSGAVATGPTVVPLDNTIPQITEGDQYLSVSPGVVLTQGNVLRVKARLLLANSAAAGSLIASLFLDANANAVVTSSRVFTTAGTFVIDVEAMIVCTATNNAISARAGGSAVGTTTFNGSAGAQLFGGVANSFIEIEELQG